MKQISLWSRLRDVSKSGAVLAITVAIFMSWCGHPEASAPPTVDYEQPVVANGTAVLSSYNQQHAFDNWIAQSSKGIAAIRWWGVYQNSNNLPTTDYFYLEFSSSNSSGLPGFPPGGDMSLFFGANASLVTRTATALVDQSGHPIFQYDAPLPFSLPILAGHEYWLSLSNLDYSQNFSAPAPNPFLWAQGSGGNNSSEAGFGQPFPFQQISGDRAFAIFVTPHPPSLLQLTIGLMALGFVTLRRTAGACLRTIAGPPSTSRQDPQRGETE